MHGPYSQEGSWLGSISHRVQFKNTQLSRGALSPNDALKKIIRERNTPRLSFVFTSMKISENSIRWSLEISPKSSLSNDVCAESHAWLKDLIHSMIQFHRAHLPQNRLGFDSVVVNITCGFILSPNRVFRIRHFSMTRKKWDRWRISISLNACISPFPFGPFG